jgi:hypothetical protein
MPTKPEIANELSKIYFTCKNKEEFEYVMKYKLDIYPGDLELLWFIIDRAWSAGNDDESS